MRFKNYANSRGGREKPENARKEKQKGPDGKEIKVIRSLTDLDE